MWVSEFIKNLNPYVPGVSFERVQKELSISEVVGLASNENFLGPSPHAIQAIYKEALRAHRYPDSSYLDCKLHLSKNLGLPPNWISFGAGIEECIDLLIRIFCEPFQDQVLLSEAAFLSYKSYAHLNRVSTLEIPLLPGYQVNLEGIKLALQKHRLVFLTNPNNPFGTYFNTKQIEGVLNAIEGTSSFLVLDEAYGDFASAPDFPNSLELLKKYKNLIVLRSASKFLGLAGLRLGYVLAHPEVIEILERARPPFNVGRLAVVAFIAALYDKEFGERVRSQVWEGLEYAYSRLEQMKLPYLKSQGNFVFFDVQQDSQELCHNLLHQGVLLRPLKSYGFNACIRMTIGSKDDMDRAFTSLEELL